VSIEWANRVALRSEWRTWESLLDEAELPPAPVAVVCAGAEDPWSPLAAAVRSGAELMIVGEERLDAGLDEDLRRAGYRVARPDGTVEEPLEPREPEPGRITVLSSGTTGRPRLVPHTLDTLATMRALGAQPPRRWLCPYAPGTYAWYQCALLGLTVPGQDVVPVEPADATGWLPAAARFGVDAISATPTFWRRAFLQAPPEELRSLELSQVSLGGEPVDQPILDRLHDLYPRARLTHIYASSEAGAAIAVSDGRAGFPAAWVGSTRPNGVQIDVRDERLFVLSPFANVGDADAWIDTGDRVRTVDDRVEVTGRAAGEVINVGGAKVVADDVADVMRSHPDVAWCRVRPRRAPVVGELVLAEVALVAGATAGESELIGWCAARLPEVAVPRIVRLLEQVPATAALKEGTS
jgi:acyl-coenzyme A synthetase/AMP-(fatty) acid ligase